MQGRVFIRPPLTSDLLLFPKAGSAVLVLHVPPLPRPKCHLPPDPTHFIPLHSFAGGFRVADGRYWQDLVGGGETPPDFFAGLPLLSPACLEGRFLP